jgi:hypothetical protein
VQQEIERPYRLTIKRPGSLLSTIAEIDISEKELSEINEMLMLFAVWAKTDGEDERVQELSDEVSSITSVVMGMRPASPGVRVVSQ